MNPKKRVRLAILFALGSCLHLPPCSAQVTAVCSNANACLAEANSNIVEKLFPKISFFALYFQDQLQGHSQNSLVCRDQLLFLYCRTSSHTFSSANDTLDFTHVYVDFNYSLPSSQAGFTYMMNYYVDATSSSPVPPTSLLSMNTTEGDPSTNAVGWILALNGGHLSLVERYPTHGFFYSKTAQGYVQTLWDPDLTGYKGYVQIFVTIGADQKAEVDVFRQDATQPRGFRWDAITVEAGFPSAYGSPAKQPLTPSHVMLGFAGRYGTSNSDLGAYFEQPGLNHLAHFQAPLSRGARLAYYRDFLTSNPGYQVTIGAGDFGNTVTALQPCNTGKYLTSPAVTISTPCGTRQSPNLPTPIVAVADPAEEE